MNTFEIQNKEPMFEYYIYSQDYLSESPCCLFVIRKRNSKKAFVRTAQKLIANKKWLELFSSADTATIKNVFLLEKERARK